MPQSVPVCNAVVLIHKKDGTLCFCIDFHHLNAETKKDLYPLPQIQKALQSMVGATHFSTMNFKHGFWQVKMAPDSQQYTTFTLRNLGFCEFTHMSFGLCNAPVSFQHLMQNTLGELNLMYCLIYLDDMIVFGSTEEEHLECPCVMFEWFQPETGTIQVLIFPIRNCVLGSPCLTRRDPPQLRQCLHS